jgi:ssDNA-binding Zn-finger/Zn-ribbon topoisomerase 1
VRHNPPGERICPKCGSDLVYTNIKNRGYRCENPSCDVCLVRYVPGTLTIDRVIEESTPFTHAQARINLLTPYSFTQNQERSVLASKED